MLPAERAQRRELVQPAGRRLVVHHGHVREPLARRERAPHSLEADLLARREMQRRGGDPVTPGDLADPLAVHAVLEHEQPSVARERAWPAWPRPRRCPIRRASPPSSRPGRGRTRASSFARTASCSSENSGSRWQRSSAPSARRTRALSVTGPGFSRITGADPAQVVDEARARTRSGESFGRGRSGSGPGADLQRREARAADVRRRRRARRAARASSPSQRERVAAGRGDARRTRSSPTRWPGRRWTRGPRCRAARAPDSPRHGCPASRSSPSASAPRRRRRRRPFARLPARARRPGPATRRSPSTRRRRAGSAGRRSPQSSRPV